MAKKTALYAGTFDPFTLGHQNILERALCIFDEITVVVAVSPSKNPLFNREQRLEMIRDLFSGNSKVKVDSWDGLIVDYAKEKKIQTIVRGLRPTGDFEIEFQMASMNNKLLPEVETVFLMTGGEHYFVSSSLVKEIYDHGGDITDFVPQAVLEKMKKNQG
ncbi:MAG: pantetheine-phosphate adenylyltransferase [Halobacteriovoraceae bacterium]|jgi:pantetheine-phosphate adenylyltransferase|nr:pantetheine-phosphate adenylyltransferase [Halobacteriovoraceae bacterium]MBT5094972.1 pantetheine-phosphate adenylyltransferase [Halobacteriovoraceae bacterium]